MLQHKLVLTKKNTLALANSHEIVENMIIKKCYNLFGKWIFIVYETKEENGRTKRKYTFVKRSG